ncbi:MAG: dTMP kinase [Elusimicrobia bacterium]|nr:dTMP kinase [Elusimicrobiota bacterium]
MKGVFIVLEGPDKSGKSTQAKRLASALRARGREVVHTREPGGTSLAEAVRRVVLDPALEVHPLAELLLYEAARAQHTAELIRPALARGAVVVCERYTLATLVYQGLARGLGVPLAKRVDRAATGGLEADLTVVLDIPETLFAKRDPSRAHDRLERESTAFRRRVRQGYRTLARRLPRTALIDADRPADIVYEAVAARVEALLKRRRLGALRPV